MTYNIKEYHSKTIDLFKKNSLYNPVHSQIINWVESNAIKANPEHLTDILISNLYVNKYPKAIQEFVAKFSYKIKGNIEEKIVYATDLISELNNTIYTIKEDKLHLLLEMPKHHRVNRRNFHYIPPKKEVPLKWKNNNTNGVITLGNITHKEIQAYDALNKLQKIPFVLDSYVVIEEERSKNVNYQRFLKVMSEYLGIPFFFVWKYDKRGRSYSQGYDINLQADEWHKAAVSLANKEVITDFDAMKVAVAGHAGLDKLSWDDRINWFDNQADFDTTNWDEPILGRKALRAYQDALDGVPSGYWMSTDATASGIQIMAVLADCVDSAKHVNLVNTGKRENVYGYVANEMNKGLSSQHHVDTELVKYPVMTRFYNSEAVPKKRFNQEQLVAFNESLNGLLPGAMKVMEVVNLCWNPNKSVYRWTLPDGHKAVCPVQVTKTVQVKWKELDFNYSYKDITGSENYRSLMPNIIHSIDGWIAREMVRRADFDIFHIHDCFAYSPNNFNKANQLYRDILIDLAGMDLLGNILTEITGKKVTCKTTNNLAKLIANSEYALS